MNSVCDGRVELTELDRVSCTPAERRDFAIRRGDILFNRTNSFALVGKSAVVADDADVVFASYLVRLRVKELADFRYVGHWFCCAPAQSRMKQLATLGVSQCNINPTALRRDLSIPLPPKRVQRKVADILGTWDEALEKLDALIAAKERRKKALMQQLLTGKRRFHEHKASPWRKLQISKVLRCVFRPVQVNEDASLDLVSLRRRCGGLFRRPQVVASEYKTQDLHALMAGDFLVSKRQVVHGAWALVGPEFAGALVSKEYSILINHAPDVFETRFFAWLCKTPRMIHLTRVASTGVHLEKLIFDSDVFLREVIRIPSVLAEQAAVADILDAADAELRLLRKQREAFDLQKRGLMQQLLTGRVRVNA